MKSDELRVIVTGTGTPIPQPGRAGAGVLVAAAGNALQFDAGRSTVMRMAEAGISVADLSAVFLTHHHSDHVSGLADVLITSWLLDAERRLDVVAPSGLTADFARDVLQPYIGDMQVRRAHRGVPDIASPIVRPFRAQQTPCVVWTGPDVEVSAVAVRHSPVQEAVGYRVDAPQGSIVISGDTTVCPEIEDLARGATVLVHEAMDATRVPPERAHTIEYHSDPTQIGAMAHRVGVGVVVLTHLWPGPTSPRQTRRIAEDVRVGGFEGAIVVASDNTIVTVADDGTTIARARYHRTPPFISPAPRSSR